MLGKKTCNNCSERIKNSYNFCPGCGIQLKETSKDWGMLGKNDQSNAGPPEPKLLGGLSGGIMNKMLGSAMKMLEKEMQKEMGQGKKLPGMPGAKVKLMINGKEVTPGGIQVKKENKKNDVKILPIEFGEDNLEKWSTLKKEEPKTNLKRLGDKIHYEIEVEEVSSIKDISIMKLEKSLEVKAIGKDKAYLKVIPIDLPLKKYTLLNGKLTLELDASM